MNGTTRIVIETYLMDLETKPETRLNIALKECTQFLLDNEPDEDN